MKYFYDTEFIEGTQHKYILGIPFGKTKPTIDLISIGIVSEDNREYYAISKDFNFEEAWYSYDLKTETMSGDARNIYPEGRKYKEYWIRENVLKPIFQEWKTETNGKIVRLGLPIHLNEMPFTYKNFKYCIECIGKTNEQIAEEVKKFVYEKEDILYNHSDCKIENIGEVRSSINFYGYYSSYDHVALCWLFGKMIDLPNGFPKYTRDLKQMLDEKWILELNDEAVRMALMLQNITSLQEHPNYPKQTNEHNALSDARWNKKLYEFLENL